MEKSSLVSSVVPTVSSVDGPSSIVESTCLRRYDLYKDKSLEYVKGDIRNLLEVRPYCPYDVSPGQTNILLEEDYVGILEAIIRRDFFPNLEVLCAEERLEEGKVNGDPPSHLQELQHALEEEYKKHVQHPSNRVIWPLILSNGKEITVDISKLSLTEFQNLFTSEDNASFTKLILKEKKKLAKQQQWIENTAATQNHVNLQISDAIKRGERPAQLLYSHASGRNNFMLPNNSESADVMGLFHGNNVGEFLALALPKKKKARVCGEKIIAKNTRLDNQDTFLNQMYEKQVMKQGKTEQKKINDALFNEMVEKGIYSANAIVDLHILDALNLHKKRSNRVSIDELRRLETMKNGFKTPVHNGYTFLHTPLQKRTVTTMKTPLAACDEPKFIVQDLSSKELVAHKLCDQAARRSVQEKIKNKSKSIREVLRATGTPLIKDKASHSLFSNKPRSNLSSIISNRFTPITPNFKSLTYS